MLTTSKGAKRLPLKELLSPTKFNLATTLPTACEIDRLWNVEKGTRELIKTCLKGLYSHVTLRTPEEGKDTFNHHIAATVWYELSTNTQIKGKSHIIKCATIYCQVKNILISLERWLKNKDISPENKDILLKFQAEFMGHYNVLVAVLAKLPEETKERLRKNQNIDFDALAELPITPQKKERIEKMHPSNSEEAFLLPTPKKLSHSDKQSITSLNSTKQPLLKKQKIENIETKNREINEETETQEEKPSSHKRLMPRKLLNTKKPKLSTTPTVETVSSFIANNEINAPTTLTSNNESLESITAIKELNYQYRNAIINTSPNSQQRNNDKNKNPASKRRLNFDN